MMGVSVKRGPRCRPRKPHIHLKRPECDGTTARHPEGGEPKLLRSQSFTGSFEAWRFTGLGLGCIGVIEAHSPKNGESHAEEMKNDTETGTPKA